MNDPIPGRKENGGSAMRKFFTRLTVLLLALALTACNCSHDWQDATCTAPKTCAKCGETEGEPAVHSWQEATCTAPRTCAVCQQTEGEVLAHNWQEATCSAPRTCTGCQETEGEPIAHSYGLWMLDGESMYRVCDFCAATESTEIDYPLYLDQHIYGHWNMYYMIQSGRFYATDQLPQHKPDTEICFYTDGRVSSLGFEEEQLSQSWTFDHGEYDSSAATHSIYIRFPEENMLTSAYFICYGDKIYYQIPMGSDGDLVVLSNHFGDEIAEMISGKWSTWAEDGVHSITFHADRSFTADIDGEITGFWQPRMPSTYNGYTHDAIVMLSYLKDGKQESNYARLQSYNPKKPQDQQEDMTFYTRVGDTYSGFNLGNEQFLTEALENADTAHLGTWTSLNYSISTFNRETYETETQEGVSTGYNITFMEDGTFSAALNNVYTGKWALQSIEREYDDNTCYRYRLTAPGINDYSYFQANTSGRGYAYISEVNDRGSNYSFQQMDEAEIAAYNKKIEAAPSMLVGEWFPTDGQDVSAVFNEDGTFTVHYTMQTEAGETPIDLTGNWYFRTFSGYEDVTYYSYDFETFIETEDPEAEPIPYREDSALRLTVSDTAPTLTLNSYQISCTMTNGEGIAIMKDAAGKITGRWSADTATVHSTEGQDSVEVPGTYYIDFAEDGSFTGYVDQDIHGTWQYEGIRDGYPSYLVSPAIDNQLPTLTQLKDDSLIVFIAPYVIDFSR